VPRASLPSKWDVPTTSRHDEHPSESKARELTDGAPGVGPERALGAVVPLLGRVVSAESWEDGPVTGGVAAGRPPFVGRERELSTLDAALQAAVAGTTSIVVVGGEAGSGKSRLLDEFSSLVRTHGVDVLSGRAWDASGPTAPRLVDQVSYRAFRGNADTLERWVEAAIEGCIHDARATRISQTADALDRQVSNSRQTCTEQTVGNDHD
jgi:hypothetical protein